MPRANYDGTNNTTALATLTNAWSHLVNPLNPKASAQLKLFPVANGAPGTDTVGVNILMESESPGTGMSNDDFGGRQFLYPMVPEPTGLSLFGVVATAFWRRRKR